MAFLEKAELKSRAHIEIIDSITRSDSAIVELIIDENIALMKGYLNARYDVNYEFGRTGNYRNKVLVKMLKALVIFDIYQTANPQTMTQTVDDEMKRAVAWLKAVQKQEVNPDLKASSADGADYIQYSSNTKRTNHLT